MEITVECYAGYRGEEIPRRIRMGDTWIEIAAVLDRWLSPDHRYFKVLGDDGAVYMLRHNPRRWAWELIFFTDNTADQ